MRNCEKRKHPEGYILIPVLMIIAVLFLLAVSAMNRINTDLGFSFADESAKKAFYIAEAGAATAFYDFRASNGVKFTHDNSGKPIPSSAYKYLPTNLPNIVEDSEGWRLWKWQPGNAHQSFTDSSTFEQYRYRVKEEGANRWSITVESKYGNAPRIYSKIIYFAGTVGPLFEYFLFGNDDLSEFVRGETQTVRGKVHSNGNLYIRPSGSSLEIRALRNVRGEVTSPAMVTAAKKIIRNTDAWGRPYDGGSVKIESADGSMVEMPGSSKPGESFDSNHPKWADDKTGAMKKWGGWVKDGALGAVRKEPPPVGSLDENGFYNKNAGLIITSTSSNKGVTPGVTFYNQAEARDEKVVELDMSKMSLPKNGLIYATTPIRIVKGENLPAPLTIASNSTIYTLGDYNSKSQKDAAILTSQRIYHLSEKFNDKKSYDTDIPEAKENDKILEIYANMVDGPPTVDEINYVKSWNGQKNSLYNPVDRPNGRYCWANSDDFLENWSDLTVKKRGSIIHMNNATMAKLDNSDVGPGVAAWVMKTHYSPPDRDYAFMPEISTPPFMPNVIQRTYWNQDK